MVWVCVRLQEYFWRLGATGLSLPVRQAGLAETHQHYKSVVHHSAHFSPAKARLLVAFWKAGPLFC